MSDTREEPGEARNSAVPDQQDVNPYAAPQSLPQQPGGGSDSGPGMVGQVTVLAILMIVQGALEAITGLLLLGAAAIFPAIVLNVKPAEGAPPPPEGLFWVVGIMYGVMGLAAIVAAVLHILGGVGAYKFRRRTFGIVALSVGAVSTVTCYCAPTAIALAVYGLVVLLNPRVVKAFAMSAEGQSRQEILETFRA